MGKDTSSDKKSRKSFQDYLLFFRHFLSPAQSTIGIDIGKAYLKIVQMQKSGNGFRLADYKVRAVPVSLRETPRERDTFIREFVEEYLSQARIKSSLGRIAVKGEGVFLFSFSLPALADKDLRGAVGIELKKRLPYQMEIDRVTYNYFITDRFEGDNATIMVTCVAVDNELLDKQLRLLKDCKMRPMIINTAADALGNLLEAVNAPSDSAILEMGVKESSLNFYKDSKLRFTREIPVGGEQITQSMFKLLLMIKGDITMEEAETFKRQCGVPLQEDADKQFFTDFGSLQGNRITTAVRPVLERFMTEVSRTISFYFRTYKIKKLDALYLTGGGSRLKNIERFISANISTAMVRSIEKLNPTKSVKGWENVGVVRQEMLLEEAAPHLSVAFGVSLKNGGRLNFIPLKERIQQKAVFMMFLARLTFPLILVLLFTFYFYSYGKVVFYQTLTANASKSLEEYQPVVQAIGEYNSFKAELQKGESLLAKAIGKQPLWPGVLKELSNITPREVTLSRLEIVPGTVPRSMLLIGEVMSEYTNLDLALSQFTLNLKDSPFFGNVDFNSKRDEYSPVPRATFEITCELKL